LEKKRGEVCSRDELAIQLYPDDVVIKGVSNNRIDSIAKRVRKKIELNPNKPAIIETVRGVGFRLIVNY
jgi:DNA-binding response OmpR family regulator